MNAYTIADIYVHLAAKVNPHLMSISMYKSYTYKGGKNMLDLCSAVVHALQFNPVGPSPIPLNVST